MATRRGLFSGHILLQAESVFMRLFGAFPAAMSGSSDQPRENLWRTGFDLIKRTKVHWIACIAISIALHAAVLFGVRVTSIWLGGTTMEEEAMDVTLVAERAPAVVAALEPPPQRSAPPSQPTQKQARPADVPALSVPLPVPPGFDEAQYTSSGRLSVRPFAMDEISVPSPEGIDYRGVVKALLTLFIDEDGTVVRTKIDDADLPPQFQEAAKKAFEQVRFHPGEIDDRPVKARMRIEVTFESGTPRR
jgi:Gram-negative bacterial TonB protein C-terminal